MPLISIENAQGPLTEELVFRSALIGTAWLHGRSWKHLVFITPLYFGIGASASGGQNGTLTSPLLFSTRPPRIRGVCQIRKDATGSPERAYVCGCVQTTSSIATRLTRDDQPFNSRIHRCSASMQPSSMSAREAYFLHFWLMSSATSWASLTLRMRFKSINQSGPVSMIR